MNFQRALAAGVQTEDVHLARIDAFAAAVALRLVNMRTTLLVEEQRIVAARILALYAPFAVGQAHVSVHARNAKGLGLRIELRGKSLRGAHLLTKPAKVAEAQVEIQPGRPGIQQPLLGGNRHHDAGRAHSSAAIALDAQRPQARLVLTSWWTQALPLGSKRLHPAAQNETARKRPRSDQQTPARQIGFHSLTPSVFLKQREALSKKLLVKAHECLGHQTDAAIEARTAMRVNRVIEHADPVL